MNIRKIIREHLEGVFNENYPAGADMDPSAPWNQKEPRYSRSITPNTSVFKTIAIYPHELAVLADAEGNKYEFYFGHLNKSDFEPYAQREIVGTEKGEDGPEHEYSDDWEIDNHVIDGYVNDNLESLTKGEGVGAWEDGVDIVKIDDGLKSELLKIYGNNEQIKNSI
jgi:hypothetical protein